MNPHLNHEQLCDLLLASRATDDLALDSLQLDGSPELERSREHVAACAICAGELAALSQSLVLFRSTADAWASHEWQNHTPSVNRTPRPTPAASRAFGLFTRPAIWAVAAAVVLAAALPISLRHLSESAPSTKTAVSQPTPPSTAQSDEALLEEIDQTLSSSVPTPMQPLADPTDSQSSNTQRKN